MLTKVHHLKVNSPLHSFTIQGHGVTVTVPVTIEGRVFTITRGQAGFRVSTDRQEE